MTKLKIPTIFQKEKMNRFAVLAYDNKSEISSIEGEQIVLDDSISFSREDSSYQNGYESDDEYDPNRKYICFDGYYLSDNERKFMDEDGNMMSPSEREIYISDSRMIAADINSDFEDDDYLLFTQKNLLATGQIKPTPVAKPLQVSSNKPIDEKLVKASKLLYSLMKGYSTAKTVKETKIVRDHEFTEYMSAKTSSFFTKLYFDSNGDEFASITSWKHSKLQNGTNVYLFLATHEGYGSCSMCDRFLSDEEIVDDLKDSITDALDELDSAGKNIELRVKIKTKIDGLTKDFRKNVNESVNNVFSNIRIFKTYNEAATFIRDRGEFEPPSFKFALDSLYKNKIQKKRKMIAPALQIEKKIAPTLQIEKKIAPTLHPKKDIGSPPGFDFPIMKKLAPTLFNRENDPWGVIAYLGL